MDVVEKAERIIDELALDFRQFTLERFAAHIEQVKGRKIFFFALPLSLRLDGGWISDAEHPHEYIFYNSDLSSIKQAHTQLHELGHLLCGHDTLRVTHDDLTELIQSLKQRTLSPAVLGFLLRALDDIEQWANVEAEAEAVAGVVQSRVIQVSRIHELSTKPADNLVQFLHQMGI